MPERMSTREFIKTMRLEYSKEKFCPMVRMEAKDEWKIEWCGFASKQIRNIHSPGGLKAKTMDKIKVLEAMAENGLTSMK